MSEGVSHKHLAVLLGAVRQDLGSGELVLEQNDGLRSLFLHQGELIHLRSDVAGEQFGSFLLRRGFLDHEALRQLLADPDRHRIGVKAVLGGLLSVEDRDEMLTALQEQIMVNALEHPVVSWSWFPGAKEDLLGYDLHFQLQHRRFIWHTFQESNDLQDLVAVLESEAGWQWEGRGDLLGLLGDLPLTPAIAFAISFLTAGPVSFETFHSLSALEREEAGRLLVTLWALGALALSGTGRPSLASPVPAAPPVPASEPERPTDGRRNPPLLAGPDGSVDAPEEAARLPLGPEPESWPADLPPCGPRPGAAAAPAAPIELEQPAGSSRFPRPAAPVLPPPPPEAPRLPPPNLEQVRNLKAQARRLASQDHTVEAIRVLEQAVRLQPGGDIAFDAWLLLGQLRMANPAWSSRAIDALQNAARLRPRATEPWVTMGEIYHRKGFAGDAAVCYLQARNLDPSVTVPSDVDLQAPAAPRAGHGSRGILDSFRAFLGGRGRS